MTNNDEVIVKCWWGSEGAVSSAAAPQQVHGGALMGALEVKTLKNFGLFTSGGQINSLK